VVIYSAIVSLLVSDPRLPLSSPVSVSAKRNLLPCSLPHAYRLFPKFFDVSNGWSFLGVEVFLVLTFCLWVSALLVSSRCCSQCLLAAAAHWGSTANSLCLTRLTSYCPRANTIIIFLAKFCWLGFANTSKAIYWNIPKKSPKFAYSPDDPGRTVLSHHQG